MNLDAKHGEPIVLLGATRRQQLTELLKQSLRDWCHEWGGSQLPHDLEVAAALCRRPGLNSGRAFAFSAATGDVPLLAIVVPMEAHHELLGLPSLRSLADTGGEATTAVVTEALRALCLRMIRVKAADAVDVSAVQGEKLAQAWNRYGLGVTVKAGERVLMRARLSPQLLLSLLPPSAHQTLEPLSSRRTAIGTEQVAVAAWLGEAEVALGELANLQVGDVILLDANVTDSGHLTLQDGRSVARIRLGSAAGRRAMSVMGRTDGRTSR